VILPQGKTLDHVGVTLELIAAVNVPAKGIYKEFISLYKEIEKPGELEETK
jgi:hypothetical protein